MTDFLLAENALDELRIRSDDPTEHVANQPDVTSDLAGISLFTGAGGLDLGLQLASGGRINMRAFVEIDRDAQATLELNHPGLSASGRLLGDIRNVSAERLMEVAGVKEGETFILAGGPPCQAFSTAGLRQGVNDANGGVVNDYFEMVDCLRPRFFVFENVRGLLSAALKHRPLSERSFPQEVPQDEESRLGSVLSQLILPTFKRMGYEVVIGLLNAADYGTAQVRHRVFVLGSRDREFRAGVFRKQTSRPMTVMDLVPPTHHRFAPYKPIGRWRTLRDAIGALREPTPAETYRYSPERAAIFSRIPAGKNWKYVRDNPNKFPKGFLEEIMGLAIHSGGGKEGYWRRLSWDRPAPTLTAQPQQLSTSLCHPEVERPLSLAEYATLQDFPSDYLFAGSKSAKYRQIGNAVPIRLAAAVGGAILAVAGVNDAVSEKSDYRPSARKR